MDHLKTQLSADGFVLIELLNEDEILLLNGLCNQYLKADSGDFISSSHFLSIADSIHINAALHKMIKPKLLNLCPDLSLLGGTLATKIKGKAVLKAHNDWTIVDEEKFNSYNLWIALVDTNRNNGTLGLIPGSHHWKSNLRGLNIPAEYEQYTSKFLEIGWEPELKAGQAILYNHKLIHYSRPNSTDIPRNVAILGMKDKAASLRVSFSPNNKTIETYEAREQDFYGFDVSQIKMNKLIAETSLPQSNLNWEIISEQYERCCTEKYKKKIPGRFFWNKWKKYFSI